MERLHYVEIQIKRARVSLRQASRQNKINWMIKPLEQHMRHLEYEKAYLYGQLMRRREF